MIHIVQDRAGGYNLPRTTIRVGNSSLTLEGHLDAREVERIGRIYQGCKAWVQQYGTIDTGAVDWDAILQGAQQVSSLAGAASQSPIGAELSEQSPYGKLVLDAIAGAGPALAKLQDLVGPSAPVVAALAHPDPAVQQSVEPTIARILADKAQGNPEAMAAHDELLQGLVRHKDQELADRDALITRLRRRLGQYSDPMSAPGVNVGALGSRVQNVRGTVASSAALAELHAVLLRAANRAPQPSWA